MPQKTRIGLTSLGGGGSVELPEWVTLYCPDCKTQVADKGQCLLEFFKLKSDKSKTGFVLGLSVDCRNCGCYGKPPAVEF
ncbi:MAG: hypothetical protein A2271_01580 [Candidatus Moranbacteria bacterium RIFOXYA12_FULL_35_19]|nr:MAG: hypothetical protein UR78_C0012G0012 [Candidatus Moranbacteria bacterium GW2011_GWF2_35_39]OGI32905.1 MAG: hypothetical protein A2489_00600 [Candidatus Moranbacteria bacterium RIFOXYC12_FULL_36_13]OGI33158.1 MAG: hypothetical protein A2343_02890 [Candidatus Moranbacteria bacterium RIFOXYB12_FULL_35_8]OGI35975.1 MAG: hypothetical protein A2271_01580 [Candidatus Moranbacteria bacterium RIFOXYA12_FULL_35_19]